jgi:predicted aspartyl protease
MIEGRFGDNKELFFEIELVAANGEKFSIEALFDTGFTDGWLGIDTQDLDALKWALITSQIEMTTARGNAQFSVYSGLVI